MSGIKRKAQEEIKKRNPKKRRKLVTEMSQGSSSYLVGSSASSAYLESLNIPKHKSSRPSSGTSSGSSSDSDSESSSYTSSTTDTVPVEGTVSIVRYNELYGKYERLKRVQDATARMVASNRKRLMKTLKSTQLQRQDINDLQQTIMTLCKKLVGMSEAVDVLLGTSEPDDLVDVLDYHELYSVEATEGFLGSLDKIEKIAGDFHSF